MTNLNMALETAHGVSSASELISFNKIPNEIISTILLLSMPDHKNDDLPRSVSMVCKRWKDVVFSTPFAWSNIHITDYSILPRIRRCLERSRNVPLLIEVATNVVQHSSSFLEVVRILAPHTDRWKNMTLAMDHRYASWNLWLKLTNGPGASYSQLEVIKICGTDLYVDEERRSMDILDMPRLRSVDLQCVPSAFLRPFLSPTVKTIMLAGIWASTDVICHAISHCSELASLSITGCHLPESITIPRSSTSLFTPNRDAGEYIIFPNLTNIGFGGSEWNDFFIRIKAPSLNGLTS
ncbi:hypothetical protein BD410DRAFT_383738 [Rickenella mellea]|uniref:Uncharacterized protein n=1 Tax=Rickenella mellea TaxID=50990 RepID=A0A4Y7PZ39_9AGAM|nr:hypothetical protein BD410DRAFT_383738 [Rickenella mellea]